MGKKKEEQDQSPNPGAVVNRDLMQRMNFLYQVASHLNQQSSSYQSSGKDEVKNTNRKRRGTLQDLATFHVRTMKAIGNKSMVKVDPSVKRTICKACYIILRPGETCKVRIKRSKPHVLVTTYQCYTCGWVTRLPRPPRKETLREMGETSGELEEGSRLVSGRHGRGARPAPLSERDGHIVFVSGRRKEPNLVDAPLDPAQVESG